MPQAAIPDLNTAVIEYRRVTREAIRLEDYTTAKEALYSWNAMLPTEYQIKISTEAYEALTKKNTMFKCNNCDKDNNQIDVFDRVTSLVIEVLTGQAFEEVWFCSFCEGENILTDTEVTQEEPEKPYYLQVVPDPPLRKDGIISRTSYRHAFINWAQKFRVEIEHQISKWRLDNRKPGEDDVIDYDVEEYGDLEKNA